MADHTVVDGARSVLEVQPFVKPATLDGGGEGAVTEGAVLTYIDSGQSWNTQRHETILEEYF